MKDSDITPVRITPEMIIRNLLANMDRVQDLIVMAVYKDDSPPTCTVNTECSPYFMAYSGTMLAHLSMMGMETKEGLPQKGDPRAH